MIYVISIDHGFTRVVEDQCLRKMEATTTACSERHGLHGLHGLGQKVRSLMDALLSQKKHV